MTDKINFKSPAQITYTVLEMITIAAIFVGNIMTIVAVAKEKKLRTKTNAIIVSLSVADILVGIFSPLGYFLFGWIQMPLLLECGLFNFFMAFPMIVSMTHLTLIAGERYIAVIYPLHYHLLLTKLRIGVIIMLAWLVPAVLAAGIFYWPKPEWDWQDCSSEFFAASYIWFMMVILMLIIVTALILYTRIFLVAWQQSKKIQSTMVYESSTKRLRDIKAAKVLSLTIGIFLVCWLPFLIYMLLTATRKVPFDYYTSIFLLLIATANSALNFCVYALMNTTFRQTFKKLCCAKCSST